MSRTTTLAIRILNIKWQANNASITIVIVALITRTCVATESDLTQQHWHKWPLHQEEWHLRNLHLIFVSPIMLTCWFQMSSSKTLLGLQLDNRHFFKVNFQGDLVAMVAFSVRINNLLRKPYTTIVLKERPPNSYLRRITSWKCRKSLNLISCNRLWMKILKVLTLINNP